MIKKLFRYCFLAILSSLLLANNSLHAQTNLDPSFGQDGKVSTPLQRGLFGGKTNTLAQPDGKVIVGMSMNTLNVMDSSLVVVVRYLDNGDLDPSWGDNGISYTKVHALSVPIHDMRIQDDGKIICVGLKSSFDSNMRMLSQRYMLRYLDDGRLDPSFGDDGEITFSESINYISSGVKAALVLNDRILCFNDVNISNALPYMTMSAHKLSDGSVDSTWGDNGQISYEFINNVIAIDVALAADSSIFLATSGHVYRFFLDGSLDSSFANQSYISPLHASHSNGTGNANYPHYRGDVGAASKLSITLQSDSKILIAGIAPYYSPYTGYGIVERYHPNGSIDRSFADTGVLKVDFRIGGDLVFNEINEIEVLDDGSIIVAGNINDSTTHRRMFAVAKFHGNGAVDTSFANRGVDTLSFYYTNTDSIDVCNNILKQSNSFTLVGRSVIYSNTVNGAPQTAISMARYGIKLGTNNPSLASLSNAMQVFPNPSSSHINIKLKEEAKIQGIFVYNVQGQLVKNLLNPKSLNDIQIDLSNVPTGLYFLKVELENAETYTEKIIVQKRD